MKKNSILLLALLVLAGCKNDRQHWPQPTETVILADMEEEGKSEARKEWFDNLHQSAPGVHWEDIEYKTAYKKHVQRSAARTLNRTRGGDLVSVANGKLEGRWKERGSSNQAGNVVATEYDMEEDILYAISGGGSLFKGTIDGLSWEVVNQDLRFNNNFLKMVEHDGNKRLLAHVNRTPHYSDDFGLTWVPATGIPIDDGWGNVWHTVVQGETQRIYLLSKPSYWSNLKLYVSEDHGESYQSIRELGSNDVGLFKLYTPPNSDEVYFVEKQDENQWVLAKFDKMSGALDLLQEINTVGFGESRANLTGVVEDGETVFYIYNSEKEVWQGVQEGTSWTRRGKFSGSPWSVGLFVSPSEPNVLLMGEVECYRSVDRGRLWNKINGWAEYYGDVANKLHADIMHFNEFVDADGDPFLLISNHGGISISRNSGASNFNIGLYGLNVSQYYSVRTDPLDSDIIYAGAQDQGFQRGSIDDREDWVEFDQVISGDYGHIIFTENGSRMWTVYPGGAVSYYDNPHRNTWPSSGFNIDSEHESVWIPPMTPHPDPTLNTIYMAGGNINGGEGSFVVEATANDNSITLDQWSTDFRARSNDGRVGAIAFSPINPERVYVSTNNGYVFTSTDGGEQFSQGLLKVPGSHYLYGSSILPSRLDEEVVYLSGSGYSSSPVVKSTDGGRIFRPMRDSMPNTMAFQIAATEDESIIFAATEAGPYAYVQSEGRWFDISGIDAPTQTYWSVEYLEEQRVARFGTYGRGIWDFEVETITNIVNNKKSELKVFPNPTTDVVQLSGWSPGDIQLVNVTGQILEVKEFSNGQLEWDVSNYPNGTYFLRQAASSIKFIKR